MCKRYVFFYDTLYYYYSNPKADTLMVYDTLVEATDSTVTVSQLLTMNIKINKSVFEYRGFKSPDNPTRRFSDPKKAEDGETFDPRETDLGSDPHYAGRTGTSEETKGSNSREGIFNYQVRDTIFRYDTIINTVTVFDTVFFATNANFSDTSFTNHIEYEKFGRSKSALDIPRRSFSTEESTSSAGRTSGRCCAA